MGGNVAAAVVGVVLLMVCGSSEAVHHVVGGDQGWDVSSDLAAWSTERIFRVGDSIWFAHSAAPESIMELESKEAFDSCDLTNPIQMYTGGLHRLSLGSEGARYFASSKLDDCHGGLKLHLHVVPQGVRVDVPTIMPAAGPKPSHSAQIQVSKLMWVGLAFFLLV